MKRSISLTVMIILVVSMLVPATGVSASQYVGTARKSDVIAYINNFPIPSFDFNGYTFIQVEDLSGYGFDVKWNEYNRTLRIIRNDSVYVDFVPTFVPLQSEVGQSEFDMHTTEVRTYIGNYGYEIECYAGKPGCTYINIENLSVFGDVQYVPGLKHMKVWIRDGLECFDIPYPVRTNIFSMIDMGHWAHGDYDHYYTFNYFAKGNDYYFCYGRLSEKYGEIIGYSYCDYGTMYIDVYDTEGVKVYTTSAFQTTSDLMISPYLEDQTDAPLTYIIGVPGQYLKKGHSYMARVTFWCDTCGGHQDDIYFVCR